jgi:Tfp pilus assembly protein FimV
MRTPTEYELKHFSLGYDPLQAHQYYLRTRKLKGRHRGSGEQPTGFARANARRHEAAKPRQRKELQGRIQSLEKKLNQLEALIRKKEHSESREDRKGKAKKERAAKEREKPKTAAEKAKAARENKKFREKHRQEQKTKAKEASNKSGGGSSSKQRKKSGSKVASVSELRTLAIKVRGQIAVAKQKLAAL